MISNTKEKALTTKQKDFCKSYLDNNGNATKATLESYNTTNNSSARAIGSENLTKPNIKQWLEDKTVEALIRIEELSKTAKSESVRLRANQDIADRGGSKAIEKITTKVEPFDLVSLLREVDGER